MAMGTTTCPVGVTTCPAGSEGDRIALSGAVENDDKAAHQPVAATAGDFTRLACLWSEQELCGRRPVKVDLFAWACHEPNLDSFLLFVKLKQLPKVPTFCEAVIQQQHVVNEEAAVAKSVNGLANRLTVQLLAAKRAATYSMFDEAEGGDWQ